jgi:hypothetical protein
MTAGELIEALRKFPTDTLIALAVRHGGEAEDFTVETDENWIVLEG